MSERILDLAERALHIRFENECLVLVDREDGRLPISLPLADLGAVVLSAQGLSLSHAALAGLASNNVAVVACDERRMPVGILLPLAAHSTHAERLRLQVELGAPRRKRLWQALVRGKLLAQYDALGRLGRPTVGLDRVAARVRSGDPENLEAFGARRYWSALFEDESFRRARDGKPPNNALNYGYAVLRATVSRSLCGCGLHPSLGLHHHNRYDAFALASDVMEPFRPLIDERVAVMSRDWTLSADLDREHRAAILESLIARYDDGTERRTLSDWILRTVQQLVRALSDKHAPFALPRLAPANS